MSEIAELINKSSSALESTEVLYQYFHKLYENPSKEKTEYLFHQMHILIDKIFSIKYGLIQELSLEKLSFTDYENFILLLVPDMNKLNLVNIVMNPPDKISDTLLIEVRSVSNYLTKLIKYGNEDISQTLCNYLSKSQDHINFTSFNLDSKTLKISSLELYILSLIKCIKSSQIKVFGQPARDNKNFKADFLKSSSSIINQDFELDRSINSNLVCQIFNHLILALFRNNTNLDKRSLVFIMYIIYLEWLSDPFSTESGLVFTKIELLQSNSFPNANIYICLESFISLCQRHIWFEYRANNEIQFIENNIIFVSMQNPLFLFLKNSFNGYAQFHSNKDISVYHILSLFITYLMPWVSLKLKQIDHHQVIQHSGFKRFIELNILFATAIFNDCILSIAKTQVMDYQVIKKLHLLLTIYHQPKSTEGSPVISRQAEDMSKSDASLLSLFPLSLLKNVSTEIVNSSLSKFIYSQVINVGQKPQQIYPFDIKENKYYIKEFIEKLIVYSDSIQKKQSEIRTACYEIYSQLMSLYSISYEDNLNFKPLSSSSSKNYTKNSRVFASIWDGQIREEELKILYLLFHFISKKIDKIYYGFESEQPKTNLRRYANIYSLVTDIGVLILAVILIKYLLSFLYYLKNMM